MGLGIAITPVCGLYFRYSLCRKEPHLLMRGRKSALVVLLTEAELPQLRAWSRSLTTAVGLVRRANVILGLHQGLRIKDAAAHAGMSETHARKWITRFLQHRLQGLHDAARPGRPSSFSPRGLRAGREVSV